jgi:hypothetical protein
MHSQFITASTGEEPYEKRVNHSLVEAASHPPPTRSLFLDFMYENLLRIELFLKQPKNEF